MFKDEALRQRVRSSLLVLVLMLPTTVALSGFTERGSEELDQRPGVVETEEEAAADHLNTYAAHYDISLAEAAEQIERRLLAQPVLDLAEAHPEYASARVVRDEGPLVVEIQFKDEVPRQVRAAGSEAPVHFVAGVGWSMRETEATQVEIHEALVDVGFTSIGSSVDIETGRIEVVVIRQRPLSRIELRGHNEDAELASLPRVVRQQSVDVVFENEDTSSEDHAYGGDTIRATGNNARCTTGFVVTDGNVNGVLTAGHCINSRFVDPTDGSADFDAPFENWHQGSWGDFQWHTTTGHNDYDDFYYKPGVLRDVAAIGGAPAVDDFLCRNGVASGIRQCDDVFRVGTVKTVDHITYRRLVAMDTRQATLGDSGAPVFALNRAWGIHHGSQFVAGPLRDVWSQARYVDEALGVTIRTN